MKHHWLFGVATLTACVAQDDLSSLETEAHSSQKIKNNHPSQNELGVATTFSTAGSIDLTNAFFFDFGTNQRTCGHCHKPAEGWTVGVEGVNKAFDRTGGTDPIFRTNDGSNSPNADTSTEAARRSAYSMLLSRGTIRVGIGIPAGGEFELIAVDDPYGFASAAELSLFRRPLPSANLTLIPQVMWDGRVTFGGDLGDTIIDNLQDQSNGATLGHAAALQPLTQDQRAEIVTFETGLFNAQTVAHDAGKLTAEGGHGSAEALVDQAFVNAPFNLYSSWATSDNEGRRAVARGQVLFNTRTRPTGGGACRGCHNAENIGTNRNGVFFTVGVSDGSRRQADQPLYTLRNTLQFLPGGAPNPAFGQVITTTDPGRALITGRWVDMNKFKVPALRALGSRAPYFHDGSANTLGELVKFYEESLGFAFTDAEEADLVAFLSAL